MIQRSQLAREKEGKVKERMRKQERREKRRRIRLIIKKKKEEGPLPMIWSNLWDQGN